MAHNCTQLHWVNREACCVICGKKHGGRYFSELKGYFSPSDYDKYEKENPPKLYNSTSYSEPIFLGIDRV